jgi:hypothetical protein
MLQEEEEEVDGALFSSIDAVVPLGGNVGR